MSEYKDFDEAVAEADEEKLTFKVAGKVYNAPAQLPAKVVLTQLKLSNEEGGIGQNDLGEWLEALIGEESFQDMLDRNVSWGQLEAVLQYLLEEYGVVPKIGDDSEGGEEEDPK
tara:strand:- start:1415 stop:1756 length:342 start_codon:yes stop_codon:yes gene_type:complete